MGEVTLTDEVLFTAAYNLKVNFAGTPDLYQRFKLQELSWGNKEHIAKAGPPYDVILCSDLLYDAAHHEGLLNTLVELSCIGTCVLLATPDGMPQDKSFYCKRFYRR